MNRASFRRDALAYLGGLLSRRTSSGAFLPEVDGFRLIAIFLVIIFHASFHHSAKAPTAYMMFAANGNIGVQLFFTLSGFILSLPFAQSFGTTGKSIKLSRYYIRRLTRLEPPYIVNLLIIFGALVIVRKYSVAQLTRHLLASILYQHNLIYGVPSTINSFAWSLEVEAQFYVLAPVLALVFRIRRTRLRRATIGAAAFLPVVIRSFLPSNWDTRLYLPGQFEWFASGFLLTEFYVSGYLSTDRRSPFWDVVAAIVGPLLFLSFLSTSPLVPLLRPVLVITLYVGGFLGPKIRRFITRRPVYLAGGMCYSTYLYHGIVLGRLNPIVETLLARHAWGVVFAVGFPIVLVCIYIISAIMFLAFEKPFMTFKLGSRRGFRASAQDDDTVEASQVGTP